jgi:protein ImuA
MNTRIDHETGQDPLAALRRRFAGGVLADTPPQIAPLGVAAIDAALPWGGLPRGAVHEIAGAAKDGAATGFCAVLLARLSADGRPVLWVAEDDDLYGPGLAAFGLSPDRLIVARARRAVEVFWTIEEALRCKGLAAVLGEVRAPTRTVARRFQLVARASGVTALLLRRTGEEPTANAVTRWRLSAARNPSPAAEGDMPPRWHVALVRCRGRIHGEDGDVERWLVEWRRATGDLAVAAEFRDGSDSARVRAG